MNVRIKYIVILCFTISIGFNVEGKNMIIILFGSYSTIFRPQHCKSISFFMELIGFTQMTKMEMMHVETAQIQVIDTLYVPSLLTCIYKCRIYENSGAQQNSSTTGESPAAGGASSEEAGESAAVAPLPPRCNTISHDENSSTCEVAFITPATKWESRNAAQSDTTKHVYVRVGYSGSTSGPSPSGPPLP